jgi:hypothetical protein
MGHVPISSEEISELCLGLGMNNQRKSSIIKMAREINPSIAIFGMMRSTDGALGHDTI